MTIRKSASFQVYRRHVDSNTSDTSGSSSSSRNSDKPLKRFNQLLLASVARHWAYFRKDRPALRSRGRSVSDAGLCSITDDDPDMDYLAFPAVSPRRSLQSFGTGLAEARPTLFVTSAAGSSCAVDEPSDGSDAEHPRRQHLRVPTPALPGQSTGNFASGAAGGGGAPRSAPATPLQLEPQPRKHDKHAVKPLSGSVPSVREPQNAVATTDGKQPSKSRQKKFQRHFPQVGPEERVLNYYSCALVGDLLLQGHLYITKNYFAFYSNVFGYVTKLLIPTASVLRITKEKVARIIPNAVGVCTRDERHVFGSLLSRDSAYKLMTHVWKAARTPDLPLPKQVARIIPNAVGVCTRDERHVFGSLLSRDSAYKLMTHVWKAARTPDLPLPKQDLRSSEVELDASEYSPEEDSSSAGGDAPDAPPAPRREPDAIITTAGAAVIQPLLLTGAPPPRRAARWGRALLALLACLLAGSAACLALRIHWASSYVQDEWSQLSGEQLYGELVRVRARLHGRAASELHAFLTTNLLLLTKVRQSLEALSGVILTDMAPDAPMDVPNETAFS